LITTGTGIVRREYFYGHQQEFNELAALVENIPPCNMRPCRTGSIPSGLQKPSGVELKDEDRVICNVPEGPLAVVILISSVYFAYTSPAYPEMSTFCAYNFRCPEQLDEHWFICTLININ
jgi:hypothetical protein